MAAEDIKIWTEESLRKARRRAKVRENVSRFRERQKQLKIHQHQQEEQEQYKHDQAVSKRPRAASDLVEASIVRSRHTQLLASDSTISAQLNSGQYYATFLQKFLESYLPVSALQAVSSGLSAARHEQLCEAWIIQSYHAASIHPESSVGKALLTNSYLIIGTIHNEEGLISTGLHYYQKLLLETYQRLQLLAFDPKGRPDLDDLQTCLWLAFVELSVNHSFANFCKHTNGLEAIFEVAGPQCLADQRFRTAFLEFRVVQLSNACLQRRPPFFAADEWVSFPGKEQCKEATGPFHSLGDIGCQIPGLLQETYDGSTVSDEWILKLLNKLQKVRRGLHGWFQHLLTRNYEAEIIVHKPGDTHLCLRLKGYVAKTYFKGELAGALTELTSTCRFVCRSMDWMLERDQRLVAKMAAHFPLTAAIKGLGVLQCEHAQDMRQDLQRCGVLLTRFEGAGITWPKGEVREYASLLLGS
ncbi:hypothetical protein LTR10_014641 [Elasticomyces elasticus]|uniref:Uncharacterized protein n=1 Tax=Exophiala sideris TaxID=1016849 RepID=A0ABR0JSV7_9EURO|nr:hypothetical protein LTR10_014641 [Elasticomyces elasticus]KAK5040619.1 hypothetical protein LTS07_001119 [Exophiala sideris]KAK5042957.1 hypothetical protein LTR13_000727 [Exophiala sideris]KAK5068997.1 hypothetical protein LTR69_001120 [Exophiala sideris]KAK5186594.1 hypothetical protein LTR44_001651 [Eurotiomycetes sp. CCFEE 6388]